MSEVQEIAGRLSEAQRRYVTDKAEWRQPTAYDDKRWMTFPPSNTHQALIRYGLVDGVGQILPFGSSSESPPSGYQGEVG